MKIGRNKVLFCPLTICDNLRNKMTKTRQNFILRRRSLRIKQPCSIGNFTHTNYV